MSFTLKNKSAGRLAWYGFLALVVLFVGLPLLYVLFSYLAVNLFLQLDHSPYGQLGGWPGYALLGLGLGAAGGLAAAQRRYRLNRSLSLAAAGAALVLVAVALVPAGAPAIDELVAADAPFYASGKGRVSCGACTVVAASSTREPQNDHTYEAGNLLRRDTTQAWISGTEQDADNPLQDGDQLTLAVAPLAGHRLTGLRLRNGYCKNAGTYQAFGRIKNCRLRLDDGTEQAWDVPDDAHREVFLPFAAPLAGPDSIHFTLTIRSSYLGTSHPEVAVAWLVPVFEPAP